MPFVSDNELGDEGYGLDLIQSDLMGGYIEPESAVMHPVVSSPGAGPTAVGLDNDSNDMDVNPSAPVADIDIVDDEDVSASPPATTQKKRGRPSLASRSASDTPTRATVAKTPKSGKSTAKTPQSGKSTVASKASDRKRRAADLEEDEESHVEEPVAKKRGRPVRTTGAVASARLAAIAAKKPTRGRPKSTEDPPAKRKRGPAKKATADDDVPADEWEVEAIVESSIDADSMEHMYLVKWKGFAAAENTWEPRKNLNHAAAMIKAFEAKKPKKTEAKAAKQPAAMKVSGTRAAAATKAALAPIDKKKPGRKPGRPPGRPRKANKA